ncbi:MAG: carbohydrate ABC transporter substrate-binding protein [Ruminococcus sp.]|uniref:ABC transporter substrate-binding protein n=1 Tax=Ruminococcus sp. TaxID=41978 RepID=UPI0025D40174|nr:ABC transporter substrate-binding protein [Ruminococcus sp.]MBR5683402.1 carbohydrate ABC transporter substrate-binding protein [Ruminococcus sp.]
MKKVLSVISALAILTSFTACGDKTNDQKDDSSSKTTTAAKDDAETTTKDDGEKKGDGKKETINVWSFTAEVPGMVEKFLKLNPDFAAQYDINVTNIPTTNNEYTPALDKALQAGGKDAPDLYCAEAAFVLKYTQGDMSSYATPYKDLGLDVDNKIAEAKIADYAVEIGTNPSGEKVALGYQATGGAFIYRRSIAKDAFGSEEPSAVEAAIGAGTGNWDKFFEAAETLKGKGYAIISGDGDLWHAVENSSDKGWIVDDKLHIDPKREAFIDLAKKLKDNDYYNESTDWQDTWFADMRDEGPKKVLGFFGPAWLINYTIAKNCGSWVDTDEKDEDGNPKQKLDTSVGTWGDWAVCTPPVGFFWGGTWLMCNKDSTKKEAVGKIIDWITLDCTKDGLQYMWANGTYDPDNPTKDCVASETVLNMSDGTLDFLGGQNMNEVFVKGNAYASGKNLTPYDEHINKSWRDQVGQYVEGNKSREDAIKDFKTDVEETLDFEAE